MRHKNYGNTPLSKATLPKANDTYPEPESGITICLHKLKQSDLVDNKGLFDDVTVSDLRKVLQSAHGFIDYTKFEYGEDFGK